MSSLLIYGSYGFTGNLIATEALERGLDPIIAGRDDEELHEQATDLGCSARRFDLFNPETVAEAIEDVDCVLNCAGPFSKTAEPLVEGCLRTGTNYVDITGEIPVIERIQRWDEVATDAGVTLLPAAGFSAVPMDCLAAHLADRLPAATALELGVDSFRIPSIGTLKTVVEGADTGGAVYRNGQLESVPAAWKTRRIDFGRGSRPGTTMPTGDVSTAHYTTGVPNVEVYAVMPQPARLALKAHRYVAPLLSVTPVQQTLKRLASLVREGPSERARKRGSAHIWGEAKTADERVVSRLRTPGPYVVTVDAAVTVAERVLAGDAPDGFQTPAGAFGSGLIFDLGLDGVEGFFDGEQPSEERTGVVDTLMR